LARFNNNHFVARSLLEGEWPISAHNIMCFGGSSKDDAGAQKSKEIERQLKDDQRKLAKEVKLLLLGECRR
jgi:guanine nucleotide-binding protein subunit alpha